MCAINAFLQFNLQQIIVLNYKSVKKEYIYAKN